MKILPYPVRGFKLNLISLLLLGIGIIFSSCASAIVFSVGVPTGSNYSCNYYNNYCYYPNNYNYPYAPYYPSTYNSPWYGAPYYGNYYWGGGHHHDNDEYEEHENHQGNYEGEHHHH